jgi:transcriptional regulator with XRE-family HTH domain
MVKRKRRGRVSKKRIPKEAPKAWRFSPEALSQHRAARVLTQDQLAKLAGTTRPQISLYETGAKAPRLGTVYKLAQALDVEVKALAEGYLLSPSVPLKGKVQVIKKNGRPEYAVLPYAEYERLVRAAKKSRG